METGLDRLVRLDELISAIRMSVQRPGYRRRLLEGLDAAPTIGTLRLLRAVEQLSGDALPSIKDVSARLAVEHSTASRGIEGAVRLGLLTKRPCAEDLRRSRVQLTERGVALLDQASARRRVMLEEVTRGWPNVDVDELVRLLHALTAGYEELEPS